MVCRSILSVVVQMSVAFNRCHLDIVRMVKLITYRKRLAHSIEHVADDCRSPKKVTFTTFT